MRRAPVNLVAVRPAGRTGNLTDTGRALALHQALPNTPSPLLLYDGVHLVKDGGIFQHQQAGLAKPTSSPASAPISVDALAGLRPVAA
ncbi:MAG: hypothetical protein R2748_32620 [Bryobacterales bacterium]